MADGRGLVRVLTPEELQSGERQAIEDRTTAEDAVATEFATSNLAGYIRDQWYTMREHRQTSGIRERLLRAMRMFNGEYESDILAEIRKFGGSEVYARLVAVKCRGATSLLRDVYLSQEMPWSIQATPDPTLPDDIEQSVIQLVQMEAQALAQAGQPVDDGMIQDRILQLMKVARQAAIKNARREAKMATERVDDLLVEGGFYTALMEFLVDLPIFPFAAMKGPVVRIVPTVKWVEGQAVVADMPRMFWNRVSPFDVYWTPGVNNIADADVLERQKLTRQDLNLVMDLPGYNTEAVRAALTDYGRGGLVDWWDSQDSERADLENTEDPHRNQSALIDSMEFNGMIQGELLLEEGFPEAQVPDPVRDYHVQAWLVGQHVIKVQLTPNPKRRHPFFITSFEKVPGTVVGNSLPDILTDLQDVANASLRALVNNLSISSGPQVVILDDRLHVVDDDDEMYPWKRWHAESDPMGSSQAPVTFFQPKSNAAELLGVYEKFQQIADDISAIPRYVTGNERLSGAGRTASGLAMMMGNAAKILQTVAANVDRDIMEPLLQQLYDMLMLTGDAMLRGDESIDVQGVQVALQKESERARQIEFLQITANPLDAQIIGPEGRAEILREVSGTLGLKGSKIVPTEEEIEARTRQQEQAAMAAAAGEAQGDQTGDIGGPGNQAPQSLAPTTSRPMQAGTEQRQRAPQRRV